MRTSSLVGCATIAFALIAVPAVVSAQVGPNDVALGKAASQSSTFSLFFSTANNAVDGNTDGVYGDHSITSTQFDYFAWWLVDLGGKYDVNSITLWNRTDCCGYRLQNFFVSVLAADVPDPTLLGAPTVWTQYEGSRLGVSTTYTPTAGTVGRYVKVRYDGPNDSNENYLQLAEVDVEGKLHQDVTATPEPASLTLFATGLGGLVMAIRRRRHG